MFTDIYIFSIFILYFGGFNMWNDDRIRTVIEFFGAKGKKTCFFVSTMVIQKSIFNWFSKLL